ncbi:ester cyclase [Geodermatophilus sp. SYSU D00867]
MTEVLVSSVIRGPGTVIKERAMATNDVEKAVVRRFFEEGWNSADVAAVSDIIHENYGSKNDDLRRGLEFLHGVEAFEEHLRQYRVLFDNLRFTVDRMIVEEETVITVWRSSGTARGHTFTARGGEQRPYELSSQGVGLTDVVDGKVKWHDMFWPRNPLFT